MRLLVNRGLEIISDLHNRFLSRMCIAEGSFQLVGLLHFQKLPLNVTKAIKS